MVMDTLREQWTRIGQLDLQIGEIERRLQVWQHQEPACQRTTAIPGVGLLIATAAVATIGDARTFQSGREFAAWLGWVPRQTGTGGRVRLLGLSQRGDTYLRTRLIHGARSVLTQAQDRPPSIMELRQRRPFNIVVVALANKMARMIWALLAHERTYQKESVVPSLPYGQGPRSAMTMSLIPKVSSAK